LDDLVKITATYVPELDLRSKAEFFKALGHPVRLLILNLVRIKPRHGEELALILNLNPATISHHLSLLADVGLLTAQKDQYYQVYSLVESILEQPLSDMVGLPQPGLNARIEKDAYSDKVIRTFFKLGKLVSIPAQMKKRQVVLEKIAEQFERGREYSEKEINFTLLDFHDDVASLRRGMIELGIMERDHGVYRLILKT
jgi:ArsR family transcriptional regulator, arsenate/arsenite/antimonite-responsive transcriptional repressor